MSKIEKRVWTSLRENPFLVGGIGFLLLLWLWWELPQWLLASAKGLLEPNDLIKLENDIRVGAAQVAGGAALLIGLFFTWRNLRISQEGQITERFTRAIDQLGAVNEKGEKKLEVRLGGIYALERIARDSERDHWPIMEILTTYVRENARWQEDVRENVRWRQEMEDQPYPPPPADIQAIMTVLGRRTRTFGNGEDQPLDLSGTDLRGANLRGVNLEGADLSEAHLDRAFLAGAHLEGADLIGTCLGGANLWRADLQGVNLWGAQLGDRKVEDVTGFTTFGETTVLTEAHLERADLRLADLRGADLTGAQLERADLEGAKLEGAVLDGTDLEEAQGLTLEQLKSAGSNRIISIPLYLLPKALLPEYHQACHTAEPEPMLDLLHKIIERGDQDTE